MGTRSFLVVKYGRGVLLTTHPLLVPWSWKCRAIPLPTLWATTGPVTGTHYLHRWCCAKGWNLSSLQVITAFSIQHTFCVTKCVLYAECCFQSHGVLNCLMETTYLDVFNSPIVNALRHLIGVRYITRVLFTFKFACFMTRAQTFLHFSTSRKLEIATALCAVHFHRVLSISEKKKKN